MISQYRALFAVPGFARLLVSSILGRLPSGMFSLAVLLLVRQQTGSFLDAGLAVGVFTLTGAALSPLQGTLVDRLGQTRVLLPCAIAQAILLVMFMDVVRAGASLGVTRPISSRLPSPSVMLLSAGRSPSVARSSDPAPGIRTMP